MKLDRKIAPEIKLTDKLPNINLQPTIINKIPVYLVEGGNQEIVRIELIFNAGLWFQKKPLLSVTTNSLLSEGTLSMSSAEIAEKIDFFGSHLNFSVNSDFSSASLLALNKFANKTIPIFAEVVQNPEFPEKELNTYLQNMKQTFIVESSKVKVLAQRKLKNVLFGNHHPFGVSAQISDFENICRNDILQFFELNYKTPNCIIISGKINSEIMQLINDYFHFQLTENTFKHNIPDIESDGNSEFFVEMPNAVQTAIVIGKLMFNKLHPDFAGMLVLNTILGGYFGSRLMTNIREKNGYTYGIGSAIVTMIKTGYFLISSEVAANVTDNALREIFIEIEKIKNEVVGDAELERVKNFISGEVYRNFDGPFAQSERVKEIVEFKLDNNYFNTLLDKIKSISAFEIQLLANKYFEKNSFKIVTSGINKFSAN